MTAASLEHLQIATVKAVIWASACPTEHLWDEIT